MNIWEILFSSSFFAAVVSSITAVIITKVSASKSYKNDYYKMVLQKRMAAYENVANTIACLKITSLDERDNKPFHAVIADKELFIQLGNAIMNNLWLSPKMTDILTDMNKIYYKIHNEIDEEKRMCQAKEQYDAIVKLRTEIENCLKTDLQELYNVKQFLKQKTIETRIEFPE